MRGRGRPRHVEGRDRVVEVAGRFGQPGDSRQRRGGGADRAMAAVGPQRALDLRARLRVPAVAGQLDQRLEIGGRHGGQVRTHAGIQRSFIV